MRWSRAYEYPMRQRAATLWHHDHRMDFTGPAIWRGVAGFHLVHDDEEAALALPAGERDLPLMIADRAFEADGALRYPSLDPALLRTPGVRSPYGQGVLGDVILVNGAPWPTLEVDVARYRLRVLNASNARRYRLALDPRAPGGRELVQIGSDGGLLGAPLAHDTTSGPVPSRSGARIDASSLPIGTSRAVATVIGMEQIEPVPEPPDRDGVPRTLFMFGGAALLVVAEVVLVALAQTVWAVVFAIASVVVLSALLLWAIDLDLQPHVARLRQLRGGPAPQPGIPPSWSGPPGHRRVLLVASEAMSPAALSPIVDGDGADTAVLVVAPALQRTRLEYWIANSDEPIDRARRVQQATTGALQRAHIPSSGHVGSRDPIAAIDDALRFFDADEIVLALHTHGRRRYGERHLRDEVEQRFHRQTIELEPQAS